MNATNQAYAPFGADPKAVFEFWASFWPTAPFFGVEWRLAPWLPAVEQTMQAFWPQPATEATDIDAAVEIAAEAFAVPSGLLDAAPANSDDLTRIKGVGPTTAQQLNGLGVFTFAQLADFDADDLRWLDENLSGLKGACIRGDWAGQAKALAA